MTAEDWTLSAGNAEARVLGDGRYRIDDFLGRGTSKEVYRARDLALERDVAVGLLVAGRPQRDRLLREVRTLAGFDHPHIVTVFDVCEQDGLTYIVAQYVQGGSVADRLVSGPLPLRDALRIARDVADALSHAHEHGVLHRDVKPSNVWITAGGTAMLGDFGLALVADEARMTRAGAVVGTPAYMPPEQALGAPVDARADLYALGATLFEMVSGRLPAEGRAPAAAGGAPPDPRTIDPAIPEGVARLIVRLLAHRPSDRPARASDVHGELDRLLADGATPSDPGPPPLARALRSDPRRPLVGRETELARFEEVWEAAREGCPQLLVITGDAGIGKTRLAAAFAERVHAEGAVVLYGRCDEEPLVNYQPFVEALRHIVRHSPAGWHDLDPELAPELRVVAQLVPELRGRTPEPMVPVPVPAALQRYRLFDAALGLLRAAMASRPMLLVLDDLQWIDKPTAQLLGHFLSEVEESPLMVFATVRIERGSGNSRLGLPVEHPLMRLQDRLWRDSRVDQRGLEPILIKGLDAERTLELVAARTGGHPSRAFSRVLQERTGGNPFFIEETLRALSDADVSPDDAGAQALDRVGVPTGALGVIDRRLSRLDESTISMLTIASVCGTEARVALLERLLQTSAVALLAGPMQEAVEAGLVEERGPDRFAFPHALVREALYRRRLTQAHRARLHLAVGEALEEMTEDPTAVASELAHHFHAAREVGGAERAVRYAILAARRASQALAYEEAAQRYRDAFAAVLLCGDGHGEQHCRILLSLGRVEWQLGEPDSARETFMAAAALARRLGDAERFARAALGFGGRWYDAGRTDEPLVGLLEEALEMLPEGDSPVRARLLARLGDALHFVDREGRCERLAREAVAMARRTGGGQALIVALGGCHTALLHIEYLDERLAVGAEWLELSRASGHREVMAHALHWRVYDLFERGLIEEANDARRRLQAVADELRQPLYRHFAAAWEAKWLEMAGRFDEAEQKAIESFEHAREARAAYAESNYAGQLFALRRDQGRLGDLRSAVTPLIGEDPRLTVWRTGLLLSILESGDAARARDELRRFRADDFAGVPRDLFWLGSMCLLAEGAAALEDDEAAAVLRRLLEPYADCNAQIGLAAAVGPVHRFLGLLCMQLGDIPAARSHFEAALAWATANGAAPARAHVQCELADLLLEQGECAEARALLTGSRDTARALLMRPLEARAAGMLAANPA